MMTVDFATFCHKGDAHRLHAPGQLRRQVYSNNYDFNRIYVCYQVCNPADYELDIPAHTLVITDIDATLTNLGIDIHKPQYASTTDQAHQWKYHVVNHLKCVYSSDADYMVFADNDCWMVSQPAGKSWITQGINILKKCPWVFVVSPNDGEPERQTKRFSQQMFLTRTQEFRQADFNQPGWDGNVNIPSGPMPEYWAMLEGRMELHCRASGQYRYVLGPQYRYYHHNKLTKEGLLETDISKY